MSNNNSAAKGISFNGLLTIAFIVLKLTKVIDWSWLWVLAPAWIPLVVLLVLIAIMRVLTFIDEKKYGAFACIFKGHQFKSTYEREYFGNGYTDYHVNKCTRCGKIKRE